jgi:aminoglycoside phosphotransferase family enzyme
LFRTIEIEESTLEDKVAFLRRPQSYAHSPSDVLTRETHMSWVFLAGNRVYKLKKPVHFPYLDFSTLDRREAACRAELALNRRLAPDVYLAVVPLVAGPTGLHIGGAGPVIDWLVVMRRLDERLMLEHLIQSKRIDPAQIDRVVATLTQFYRQAPRVFISSAVHRERWRQNLINNRRVLLDARLGLPAGLVRRIDQVQRRFLTWGAALLRGRVLNGHIVDGHGDLRPEHVWLGEPPKIIDCLEFNPGLRAVDPLDEFAYLGLECERLGSAWASERIRSRMAWAFHDGAPEPLFTFYRCQRATLRARLAIAHLLEPSPRAPEKWPKLACSYLRLAEGDARSLERWF